MARANHIDRNPGHDDKANIDHIIKGSVIPQIDAEKGGPNNADAICAFRQAIPLPEHIFNDKLPCQCGNEQIQVLETG